MSITTVLTIQTFRTTQKTCDEAELIQKSIKLDKKIPNLPIAKGDSVRLLNKRRVFEKEGQRYTGRIFIVEKNSFEQYKDTGL